MLSPSLQRILLWNVSDSPLDSGRCVITIYIQTRNKLQAKNILHNIEVLTENFHKPIKYAEESEIPIIEINKHFSKL